MWFFVHKRLVRKIDFLECYLYKADGLFLVDCFIVPSSNKTQTGLEDFVWVLPNVIKVNERIQKKTNLIFWKRIYTKW